MMKRFLLKTVAIAALAMSCSLPAHAQVTAPSPGVLKAISQIQQGDVSGAMASLNAAIQANPKDSQAYHNRAVLYLHLYSRLSGDAAKTSSYLDQAMADANQAIQLDPDNFYAWRSRGQVRSERGDFQGAASDYAKSYFLVPLPSTAYLRGITFARLGDRQSAIALLQEAAMGFKAEGRTERYQMALDEIKKLERP